MGGGASTPKANHSVSVQQAFADADRDNDGKVSWKELHAQLQRLGVAWSEKQATALFGALDANGDGVLDVREYELALENMAYVLNAMSSSRLAKTKFDQPMRAWSQSSDALLPKPVLLSANVAAVQAIGPCYLAVHNEKKQVEELQASFEALKEADVMLLIWR